MLEGLYSAAAGMAAQQQRLDAVSNDIANTSTPGYKRVRMVFSDLAYSPTGMGGGPRAQTGAGAAAKMAGRSFAQGALQPTERSLDVALEGPGFMQVRRPNGDTALTRNGALQIDARGQLATSDGLRLVPNITVPGNVDPDKIKIGRDGTVSAEGRRLGKIELVDVNSPDGLRALGDNLFAPGAASGPARASNATALTQGALEASNTDISDSMVDMMDAQRSFQLASQAVQTQDQVMEVANGIRR